MVASIVLGIACGVVLVYLLPPLIICILVGILALRFRFTRWRIMRGMTYASKQRQNNRGATTMHK